MWRCLLWAALSGCGGAEGAIEECDSGDPTIERWGTDCACCHAEFGVAGSVELEGPPVARVIVIDRDGRRAIMSPNPYGNFFRHVQLVPPLAVSVESPDGRVEVMEGPAPHGSCNRCHGAAGGPPRVSGPAP